jgi:hypothetical protein
VKAFLEIGGALLTLAGVVLGVYGTFLMTKFIHPYGPIGFFVSMLRMIGRSLIGRRDRNKEHAEVAAAFAELIDEKKGEILSGTQWVFFGFFLQTMGAVLIAIDAFCLNFKSPTSP